MGVGGRLEHLRSWNSPSERRNGAVNYTALLKYLDELLKINNMLGSGNEQKSIFIQHGYNVLNDLPKCPNFLWSGVQERLGPSCIQKQRLVLLSLPGAEDVVILETESSCHTHVLGFVSWGPATIRGQLGNTWTTDTNSFPAILLLFCGRKYKHTPFCSRMLVHNWFSTHS